MKALLAFLLICLGLVSPVHAATEAVEIYYLPLHEAAEAVKTQLSDSGKVAVINSARLLLIDDKPARIKKAKALLKKLDRPTPQFSAIVEIEDVSSLKQQGVAASGTVSMSPLPGGWARVNTDQQQHRSSNRSRYQLRIIANQPGRFEAGTIQTLNRTTRLWLSGYGVVQASSVELVPITSGFQVQAWPAGDGLVRVRITPWMKRLDRRVSGQQEMLVDLGTARNPVITAQPKANMRYNANPAFAQNSVIEIAGAATELTIPLDRAVTVAAIGKEAQQLGKVLLGSRSTVGKRHFIMRLKVSRQ